MSSTTFSIAPLTGLPQPSSSMQSPRAAAAAQLSRKGGGVIVRPPNIVLPLPSAPRSDASEQPQSPIASAPAPPAPTSPVSQSGNAALLSARSRRRDAAAARSPPPARKPRTKSPVRSLPFPPLPVVSSPTGTRSALRTRREAEETPAFLTEPHKPVYQTHTTLRSEEEERENAAASALRSGKKAASGGAGDSEEDRRARFYRLLHAYHVHATDEDLSQHSVIFPPGLLQSDGGMDSFIGEFTAMQSAYSGLLSLLSSLPQLCLALNADGFLTSYSLDPSSFLGLTPAALSSQPYQRWYQASSSGSLPPRRSTIHAARNSQLVACISLAFSSKQTIREEHLMILGSKGRAVPCSVTVVPVLRARAHDNLTSFDDRFVQRDDALGSPAPQSPAAASSSFFSASSPDDAPLTAHAFRVDEEEQREQTERRERAAREERRGRELSRVLVVIENKEIVYQLSQQTKRVKEAMRPEARGPGYDRSSRLSVAAGAAADGEQTRRRSQLVVQPKLDTGISAALHLMSTLASQERVGSKRRLYAEIIHMLSHSKGMESVNDDVITQIEDNSDVGAELKSWLINQINPTNSTEDRLPDDKDKEKEKELKRIEDRKADDEAAADEPPASAAAVGAGNTDRKSLKDGKETRATVSQPRLGLPVDGGTSRRVSTQPADSATAAGADVPLSPGAGPASAKPSPMLAAASASAAAASAGGGAAAAADGARAEDGAQADAAPRLPHHPDDGQFVDPSPEVSLLVSRKAAGARQSVESSAVGPPSALSSTRGSSSSGGNSQQGSIVLSSRGSEKRTDRQQQQYGRTLKDRRSLHEKKSIHLRNSLTQQKTAAAAALRPNSPSPQLPSTPAFAPARGPVSLPLALPMQEKHQPPVERAAEARVLYNNWSLPLESPGLSAASGPASPTSQLTTQRGEEGQDDGSGAVGSSTAVVLKESVFTQVGCPPPEIHHNAALDCNAQTLFWSSLQPAAFRPATTVANAAARLPHTLLHSPIHLTPSAEAVLASCLSSISVWNQFNIFQVSAASSGWPLTFTFTTVVSQLGLMGKWGIDAVLLSNFIREVERGYFANPYHSSTHAADVLQHCYHMVTQTHLGLSLSDLDVFLLLVAAAVHDYGHPGVSNQFLTTSFSPLALQYNDRNVLESFHIASVFLMMAAKPESNLFQHMDAATYRKARKMLIDLVLATDLSSHFDILAVWKRKESILDCNKDEDRLLVLQMILKSGDLGHPSRVRHLHLSWSELITEEFFLQGDRERKSGMTVSAMMDRNTCNIVTSQIGFISFLVMPIFTAFAPFIGTERYAMTVKANLALWERLNMESEELRRLKEDEETELRRLVAEKEIMESRKRREQQEKEEEQRRATAAFEADMQKQKEEEDEAARKEEEMQRAQEIVETELKQDEQQRQQDADVSPIVDVQLRRENDAEWSIADISDSEDEADDRQPAVGGVSQLSDDDEEAERARRRSRKLRLTEQEREEQRVARKQAKLEQRLKEREEKKRAEAEEKLRQQQQQAEQDRQQEESWERSKEREDQEIESRLRAISFTIHSKMQRRGRADSGDDDAEQDEEAVSIALQEAKRQEGRGFEQQQADAKQDRPPVPEDAAAAAVEKRPLPEQEAAAGSGSAAAEASPPSQPPSVTFSAAVSPRSLQRLDFAERLRLSILQDRERVEAEREKQRLKQQKERTRAMSVEELRASEEAARLERKVRRLLRREQAAARAKAKQDEIDSLFAGADEEKQERGGAEPRSSRKSRLLDSARRRQRNLALREVSMLMMDKEWGVRRDRAEETRIMTDYLKLVSDEDDGDDDDEQQQDGNAGRGVEAAEAAAEPGSAARKDGRSRRKLRPSGLSPPAITSLSSVAVSTNAEEWEDESERGQHRASLNSDSELPSERSDDSAAASRRGSTTSNSSRSGSRRGRRTSSAVSSRASSAAGSASLEEEKDGGVSRLEAEECEEAEEQQAAGLDELQQKAAAARRARSVAALMRRPATASHRKLRSVTFASLRPQEDDEADERAGEQEEADEADDDQRRGDEEKETLHHRAGGEADAAAERQRRRDKQRALAAQRRRAAREAATDAQAGTATATAGPGQHRAADAADRYPALQFAAASLQQAGAAASSSSSLSSFTSFPPLAPSAAAAAARSLAAAAAGSAAGEGLLLSRGLVPAKADASGRLLSAEAAVGSDWHAMEDEQALAAILRRVIPRSRQAELERARRAIVTKAKMKEAHL